MAKTTIRTRHDRRAEKAEAAVPPAIQIGGFLPDGFAQLLWIQIEPDPLNPRKHFDEAAIDELADSIARDTLLENLVVRPFESVLAACNARPPSEFAPTHRLVAGERRWRAIKRLIERGDWPRDRPIMCKVVDLDDAGHRRVALVENLQRKDLRPIDEAQALKELMAVTGQGTADVAKEIGFTQRFVQQRLQLLELPEKLKDQVNAGTLTIEGGREAAALWPKLPPIKQLELREGKITVDAAKDWLARQAEPLELTPEQELILLEVGWALAAKSNGYWTTTPCDYRVHGLPREMAAAQLIAFERGYNKTELTVRLTSKSYNHLRRISGADEHLARASLEPHLRKARVATLAGSPLSADYKPNAFADVDALFKAKRYVTPWLNPPFQVDPAIKAQRQAEAAAGSSFAQEQAEREANWTRQREEAETRRKAAEAKSLALVRAFNNPPWPKTALEDLCATAGHPLPWSFHENDWGGDLLDANNQQIDLVGGSGDALMRIVMCAMNAAVDLPPFITLADAEGEDENESEDQIDLEDAIAEAAE